MAAAMVEGRLYGDRQAPVTDLPPRCVPLSAGGGGILAAVQRRSSSRVPNAAATCSTGWPASSWLESSLRGRPGCLPLGGGDFAGVRRPLAPEYPSLTLGVTRSRFRSIDLPIGIGRCVGDRIWADPT